MKHIKACVVPVLEIFSYYWKRSEISFAIVTVYPGFVVSPIYTQNYLASSWMSVSSLLLQEKSAGI